MQYELAEPAAGRNVYFRMTFEMHPILRYEPPLTGDRSVSIDSSEAWRGWVDERHKAPEPTAPETDEREPS